MKFDIQYKVYYYSLIDKGAVAPSFNMQTETPQDFYRTVH